MLEGGREDSGKSLEKGSEVECGSRHTYQEGTFIGCRNVSFIEIRQKERAVAGIGKMVRADGEMCRLLCDTFR